MRHGPHPCPSHRRSSHRHPLHRLYDRLRTDVVDGSQPPGSRLAIKALSERYANGQTPLREALNRLVAEGLVQRREQRSFIVADIGPPDLTETTQTRCWQEEIALRDSIAAHGIA